MALFFLLPFPCTTAFPFDVFMAPSQYTERASSFDSSKAGSLFVLGRALDVQPSPLPNTQVLAASTDGPSRSTVTIILSVVLAVIGVAALVGLYFIVTQRKQLRTMRTIRVIYNVDNISPTGAAVTNGTVNEKSDSEAEAASIDFDLEKKPELIPEPHSEPPHVLIPFKMPSLRRSRGKVQPLTIIIPTGGTPADVELVTGPLTSLSAASATTRRTAVPSTAVSSAISTAAINFVRREKVMQSNGWAPATIVYLPTNPKNPRTSRAIERKRTTARSFRGIKMPRTAGSEATSMTLTARTDKTSDWPQ